MKISIIISICSIFLTYATSQASSFSGTCGANIAPGVWKEFDCYNLAAIGKLTGADPFMPSWELIGGYWQWGRKGPDPKEEDWYNTNTPHFAHGPTGDLAGDANSGEIDGWDINDAPDGSWSDSNKTANDPCPDGFRVPTKSHWEGVLDNNPQSTIGTWNSDYYESARFFGENLMLPAAGFRDSYGSGVLSSRDLNSNYWSSSPAGTYSAWYLFFDNEEAYTSNYFFYRTDGLSVRCIVDDSYVLTKVTAVLTNISRNYTIAADTDAQIYGTSAPNEIILASGSKAKLINFPGQNTIQIQSSSDLFIVFRSGTLVTFQGSDGTVLKIPATKDIQTISFNDGESMGLQILNNQVMLDNQIITTTPEIMGT